MPSRFHQSTRRGFLKTAAAAVVSPYVITSTALGGEGRPAASERITMGVIGTGGRGMQMVSAFVQYPEVQFVAACDVDTARCQQAKNAIDHHYGNKDCATYRDLRQVLDRKDIDAVLIATGDRWHGVASIMAAKAGKDVYSEKPMSLTIAESRAVADTMRRHATVYQCGTQRRSVGNFGFAVRLAHSGRLGKLRTMYACIKGMGTTDTWLPAEPEPPKDAFDWNMWLGQAPWRPYNKFYVGGLGTWGNFFDFAGGGITDWGSHTVDLCQWANESDSTSPIEYDRDREGDGMVAMYANGVKLVLRGNLGPGSCGIRLEGDEGWVYTDDDGRVDVHPASLRSERKVQTEAWSRPAGHVQNFLDCIKTRRQPVANADVAHRATSACHIANICLRLGRKLRWDPVKEEFIGDETANRMRSRAMREPWNV